MKKTILAVFILLVLVCPAQAKLTPQQARAVWQEVARPTGLTDLPFYFKQSITPNAWVTAGKSVTVTSGLLDLLDTENELYGVLAHEAGHVKLKHSNHATERAVGKFVVSSVLGSLFGSAAGNAASIGTDLVAAGYSRGQEIEADDYAVKLAWENGQDLTGLYRALKKMSAVHKTEPSGFNSHPPDERRLLHIKNTINEYKYRGKTAEPLPEQKTDGKDLVPQTIKAPEIPDLQMAPQAGQQPTEQGATPASEAGKSKQMK